MLLLYFQSLVSRNSNVYWIYEVTEYNESFVTKKIRTKIRTSLKMSIIASRVNHLIFVIKKW